MSPKRDMEMLAGKLRPHFRAIHRSLSHIRRELDAYADGKKLKGDEIVGWLGEIYGKLLLGGTLVSDEFEYDFEARDRRVSVKARKGRGSGWTQTSAIPKIEGSDCPSHLMFVHLNDDYSLDRIWLYPWSDLVTLDRFKPHMVRGSQRSFIFRVNPSADGKYLEYPKGVRRVTPAGVVAKRPDRSVQGRQRVRKTVPWSAEQALSLKQRRGMLGLTQAQVGELTGIGRRRYSWIEYPEIVVPPRSDELKRIGRVLKIDPRASKG